jgi:hypothetical protein
MCPAFCLVIDLLSGYHSQPGWSGEERYPMYDERQQITIPPLGFCSSCMISAGVWFSAVTLVNGTGYCSYHLAEDGDPTGIIEGDAQHSGRQVEDVRQDALLRLKRGQEQQAEREAITSSGSG